MDIKKMISIVQIYIHIRKGVEVDISVSNIKDMMLLSRAYNIATDWLSANNVKIV